MLEFPLLVTLAIFYTIYQRAYTSLPQDTGCRLAVSAMKVFGLINVCLLVLPDVDECREKLACLCPECNCKNTWGSYDCTCNRNLLYMREHDTCISKNFNTNINCGFVSIIIIALAAAGYAVYQYRIRVLYSGAGVSSFHKLPFCL